MGAEIRETDSSYIAKADRLKGVNIGLIVSERWRYGKYYFGWRISQWENYDFQCRS